MEPQYTQIIADEVNVKQVLSDVRQKERVQLDTTITPELKAEGDVREFMRAVQGMRKVAGLQQQDRVSLMVQTSDGGAAVLDTHKDEIIKTVGATALTYGDAVGEEVLAGDHSFTVEMQKVG